MRDLYLKFDTEADWDALDLEADPALLIDVVGEIVVQTGWLDEETPIMDRLDGWHVNIRCTDDRDLEWLEPFIVTPENPKRVWAGG